MTEIVRKTTLYLPIAAPKPAPLQRFLSHQATLHPYEWLLKPTR